MQTGAPKRTWFWPFQKLSWAGLNMMLIFASLVICITLLRTFDTDPVRGLIVRLVTPDTLAKTLPGLDPLIIRIERDGRRNLYIGSRLVPPQEFEAVLRRELAHRPPHWPVFVDGHPDIDWRPVGEALDYVKGLHAEAALLPHTKK